MNEDEAYERVIESVERTNISSARIDFPLGIRFPFPNCDILNSLSKYNLTDRRKNSLASEAVRNASP